MTPALAVRDLTFRYRRGDQAVFRDVCHDFAPGALTAVTGPSGSGKSTLLYVLGLMLTPSSGSVTWGGRPVTTWSDGDRSRLRAANIGFVFQDAMLDASRTALENVAEAASIAGMTRAETTRQAMSLMTRFGVAERAHHRPGEVSGGQAQRIALCRALVKRPALLLADEPTGNLDSDTADVVWQALDDAAGAGATVVVATHDQQRARTAAHRVVVGR